MARLLTQYNRPNEGIDLSTFPLVYRQNLWVVQGCTGNSSLRLWAHMTGTITEGVTDHYPKDLSDFNRVLLLLEAVPEWRERVGEMASHGPHWAAITGIWGELTALYLEEAGLNWSQGHVAERAAALLKNTLADVHATLRAA